jgi:hypothetical protein
MELFGFQNYPHTIEREGEQFYNIGCEAWTKGELALYTKYGDRFSTCCFSQMGRSQGAAGMSDPPSTKGGTAAAPPFVIWTDSLAI